MWPFIHGAVEAIGWISIISCLVTLACLLFGKPTVDDTAFPAPITPQKAQGERFRDLEDWRHG